MPDKIQNFKDVFDYDPATGDFIANRTVNQGEEFWVEPWVLGVLNKNPVEDVASK